MPPRRDGPTAVVAGAGGMGRWHAHALDRVGVRILGVADPDGERARSLARRHNTPAHGSLNDALESSRPDAVHVCAPLPRHEELSRTALDAGCHVLCEKPLTPGARATRSVLKSAARADLHLVPVHQFLFQRGTDRLRRSLPDLRPVRALGFTAFSAGAEDRPGTDPDSIVADILPHPLSLLGGPLGVPVETLVWDVRRPAAGELHASAVDDGASIDLRISMSGRPRRNELEVVGEGGSVLLDLYHGFAIRESPEVSRVRKALRPFLRSARRTGGAAWNLGLRLLRRQPAYPGLRTLIRRFYAAVRGDAPVPIRPEEALAVAEARDAIIER